MSKKPIGNDTVSISTLLYKHSPRMLLLLGILSCISGFFYSLIIPFILAGLNSDPNAQDSTTPLVGWIGQSGFAFGWYLLLVASILVLKIFSMILVNNIAKEATAKLKIKLARKVNRLPIELMESFGASRLINILMQDVYTVSNAAVTFPMLIVSFITAVGMLTYLAILDIRIFTLSLIAIAMGAALLFMPFAIVRRKIDRARTLQDVVQDGIRGVIYGAYELKLDSEKSKQFIQEEVSHPETRSIELQKSADAIVITSETVGDMLVFFVVGFVAFLAPLMLQISTQSAYGIIMIVLYLSGPIAHILTSIQGLTAGRVALNRIHGLLHEPDEQIDSHSSDYQSTIRHIQLKNVCYAYPDQGAEQGFQLSDINLELYAGEITFIVGGNGSGKSTLSKLVSLHYLPREGQVIIDGQCVTTRNINSARKRIAVILPNFFLFQKIYKPLSEADIARTRQYLKDLELEGKTQLVDGAFTNRNLSDGQRKRLALLVAFLQDADIYVFDEWAADQDPEFKLVFYSKILADLKRRGKIVVVITHDDRYFSYADKLIRMERGAVLHAENTLKAEPA